MKKIKFLVLCIAILLLYPHTSYGQVHDDLGYMIIYSNNSGVIHIAQPSSLREFDNTLSRVYYLAFGSGFSYIQRNANVINNTFVSGSITLNVLESMSLFNTWEILDNSNTINFNEIESFTIFTVTDSQNRLEGDFHVISLDETDINEILESIDFENITLAEISEIEVTGNQIYFIYFDEANLTNYFLLHQFTTGLTYQDNISKNFIVNTIKTNLSEGYEDIDFVLTDLLVSQGNFVTKEHQGFIWSLELEEMFGSIENFLEGKQSLELGAIEVSIGNNFITNIALVDNFLHIQFREETPFYQYLSLGLYGTHSDIVLFDTYTGSIIEPIYMLFFAGNNNTQYTEDVIDITNLNIEDLIFRELQWFFEEQIDVDINVTFTSPVVAYEPINFVTNSILLGYYELDVVNLYAEPMYLSFTIKASSNITSENDWLSLIYDIEISFLYTNEEHPMPVSGIFSGFLNWFIDEDLNLQASIFTAIDIDNLEAIILNGVNFTSIDRIFSNY